MRHEIFEGYEVVRSTEVAYRFQHGWLLHGQPLVINAEVFQVMVRHNTGPRPVPLRPKNRCELNAIDRQCIEGRMKNLTYSAIGQQLNCSKYTVRNRLVRLRKRFGCQDNMTLITLLKQYGY